jgi:VWFA-related protein
VNRRPVRRTAAAIVVLLAIPAAAEDAPEPPRLSSLFESATSSLVLIEFWARDPEGHAVAGLRPEEVRLYVDGARRPFVSVEPALPALAGGSATSPIPGDGTGPAAARARRFVLFFNDGMSQPERMARARSAALDFLAKGGAPGDLFAIASSEEHRRFRLIQDFSADRERVTESLRRNLKDGTRVSSLALELAQPQVDGAAGHLAGTKGDPDRARQYELWLHFMGEQIRASGRGVADGLEAVIAWLAPFRGPKAILYCGDGLAGATQRELDRVSRAASAASVTIHAANTSGLTIGSAADDVLATLALTTGGLRVNSNDASALFRGVDAEAGGAYVLSFVPEVRADGRPHSLRLDCTRPGVLLRNRKIFVRETPEQIRKRSIEAAFLAPELHGDFALDAMVPARGDEARDLLLYVPADRLLFVPTETNSRAEVEIGVVARDDRDKVVASLSRRVEVHLPRATVGRPAINLRLRDAIPAAAQSVTAVVEDLQSGALGASRTETGLESHVAALTGLAIGLPGERSLWISTDVEARSKGAKDSVTPAFGAARRMRFRTTDSPVCEVHLAAARPEGGRGLRIVLLEGDTPALILPLDGAESIGTGGGTLLRTRLPLRDVPAGDLLLKLEEVRNAGPFELGRLPLRLVPGERSWPLAPVGEQGAGGVAPVGAGEAAARVRPGAAQIQPAHGGAVAGPAEDRAHREDLVERLLAVEQVAAGQAPVVLQILRGDHLAALDEPRQVRGGGRQRLEDAIPQLLAPAVPVAVAQGVRRVLDQHRHHVLPRWSEGRVEQARDGRLEVRMLGDLPVLRSVEGALQVVDAGAEENPAAQR